MNQWYRKLHVKQKGFLEQTRNCTIQQTGSTLSKVKFYPVLQNTNNICCIEQYAGPVSGCNNAIPTSNNSRWYPNNSKLELRSFLLTWGKSWCGGLSAGYKLFVLIDVCLNAQLYPVGSAGLFIDIFPPAMEIFNSGKCTWMKLPDEVQCAIKCRR